jgi:hypothetical protein
MAKNLTSLTHWIANGLGRLRLLYCSFMNLGATINHFFMLGGLNKLVVATQNESIVYSPFIINILVS